MNVVSKDVVKLVNLKVEPRPNIFRVAWVNDVQCESYLHFGCVFHVFI